MVISKGGVSENKPKRGLKFEIFFLQICRQHWGSPSKWNFLYVATLALLREELNFRGA